MNLVGLLEKSLKSDELIELFEDFDVRVIYAYDRLHEGREDRYFASIYELGFQFIFNSSQTLKTIFVYTQTEENFQAANLADLAFPGFRSKAAAIEHSNTSGIAYSEGEATFFGEQRAWVKQDFATYTLHYEFRGGLLCLITIQSKIS